MGQHRVVVIEPDPRIRGSFIKLLQAAGHHPDEFSTAQDAAAAAVSATLVFAAGGPGGTAIDPTQAALSAAGPVPPIIWTGPVAATLQPAVTAGVGAGVLELPTNLPRLKGVLARHLRLPAGDKWSGHAFLAQVNGEAERYPPIRVLYLAHRLSRSGKLRVGSAEITVQNGQLAEATGLVTVGHGGGVMHAVGAAMGRGLGAEEAMTEVGRDILVALLTTPETSPVHWQDDDVRAPVVLPQSTPRLLKLALAFARPVDAVRADLAGSPSQPISIHAPDDAPQSTWGLDAVSMRVIRAARKSRTMGDLVAAAGGASRDEVWSSIDFLRHLGLLREADAGSSSAGPRIAHSDAQDELGSSGGITIEAVELTPEDPRLTGLKERLQMLENTPPWQIFELEDPGSVNLKTVDPIFRKLSAEVHPDRFAGESDDLRAVAADCFAALADARDRFEDEAFRVEVRDRLIAARDGRVYVSDADAKKAKLVRTRAEHASRRKDWAVAATGWEEALALDPTHDDAQREVIVAHWKAGDLSAEAAVDALSALKPTTQGAVAERHFQLGEARLAAGETEAAQADFQRVLKILPDHVGATRHVRLHARRAPKSEATDKPSGLRGLFSWGRRKG